MNIRTLSTNGIGGGSSIGGLLYVPDLNADDPESCYNKSEPYVPANSTRRADLPDTDYPLVALAPWLSPACTLAYLNAARRAPTQAFIFFLPDDTTSEPPQANNVRWDLGDGGQWKSDNSYPVYVVPGSTGTDLVNASAQYSGDMASVPHGEELLQTFDARDYVRLYLDVDTGESGASMYQYLSTHFLWHGTLAILAW